MKLSWGDIGGVTPGAAPTTTPPRVAEVVEQSPASMVDQADNFLDQAIDMIRKIDGIVGMFLQLSGKGESTEQPALGAPGSLPAPPQVTAPPDQILELLDKILQGEGDIPMSRFVDGIRNQESWLIKYATGGNNETRP